MDLAERITAAYHRVWGQAAEATGHPVEKVGGMALVATGQPSAFFNRAFVQEDPEDPGASLDEAYRFFGDLPFFFEVRRDLHPRAAGEAAARGLAVGSSEPGMAMSPIDAGSLRTASEGLDIRLVSSDEDVAINLRISAEAFGIPFELVESVFGRLMIGENVRSLTGWYDGSPVATSIVIADDGLAGIYSVATLSGARGRGFGEAMTAAAVRFGTDELECTESYLQSSTMGKPIYERMGFRTVTTYDGYSCNA